jgi:hypothetical protein
MLPNWNQSPNVVKLLQIFLFWNLVIFLEKKEHRNRMFPFLFLFFAFHQNFQGKTKTLRGMDTVVKWTSNDDPVSRAQYHHPHSFLGNEKLVNNQPSF